MGRCALGGAKASPGCPRTAHSPVPPREAAMLLVRHGAGAAAYRPHLPLRLLSARSTPVWIEKRKGSHANVSNTLVFCCLLVLQSSSPGKTQLRFLLPSLGLLYLCSHYVHQLAVLSSPSLVPIKGWCHAVTPICSSVILPPGNTFLQLPRAHACSQQLPSRGAAGVFSELRYSGHKRYLLVPVQAPEFIH